MNSEFTENTLITIYDNFVKEQQKLMNDLKNCTDDNTSKHLHKEINIIHSIEIHLLKLKSLKKLYDEKIKNL
jgi:hypothetical protein